MILERPDALSCPTRCVYCASKRLEFLTPHTDPDFTMRCEDCGEEQPEPHRHVGVFTDEQGTAIVCTVCGCTLEEVPDESSWVPDPFIPEPLVERPEPIEQWNRMGRTHYAWFELAGVIVRCRTRWEGRGLGQWWWETETRSVDGEFVAGSASYVRADGTRKDAQVEAEEAARALIREMCSR